MNTSSFSNTDEDNQETTIEQLWPLFNSLYKTEEDCVEVLLKILNDDEEVQCNDCGSQDIERGYGTRVGRCRPCNRTIRFTAGTFFNRIRLARPYVAAIWLMEKGARFSALQLAKLVDTACSTAWKILKKLAIVIQSHMEKESLATSVSSACFAQAICKRSLETPANEHPFAEQAKIEKQLHPHAIENLSDSTTTTSIGVGSTDSTTSAIELGSQEKEIFEILSTEPLHFNDLCKQTKIPVGMVSSILTMLELDGLAESKPGDRFVRAMPKPNFGLHNQSSDSEDIKTGSALAITIAANIDFVRATFHGTSRKYLQFYLAAHWCHVDRVRWPQNSLLKACRCFRRIKSEEILAYVSPPFVKIMPC